MTGANFSSWFSNAEGTLYADSARIANQPAGGFPRIVCLDNGTGSNLTQVLWNTTTNRIFLEVVTNGAAVAGIGPTGLTQLNSNKAAASFKVNDFSISVNGGAVSTDTDGTLPVVDSLRIGVGVSGVGYLNGTIKKLAFYPKALPANLVALTG
jgi:hypothetical protein